MRMRHSLIALAATLLPAPALADVSANYTMGSSALTIEADDGGDWRFQITGHTPVVIIQRGGTPYIVITDTKGVVSVVVAEDFFDAMIPLAESPLSDTGPFKVEAGAAASVAGYPGTIWQFSPGNEVALELLLSADPALVPVGDVFRDVAGMFGDRLGHMLGPNSNFGEELRLLLAKGTVLRARLMESQPSTVLELGSVSTGQIDSARLVLPGPVITVKEAVAKLQPPGE